MCNKSLPTVRCRTIGLCGISVRFQTLSPTQGQVAHALLTRPPLIREPKLSSPFDLNVLCTPPALILSQDQTLEIMVSKRPGEGPIKSISSLIAHLLFFRVCISLSELSRCSAQSTHFRVYFLLHTYLLLFNFQGPFIAALSRGDFAIIPHPKPFVNRFFKSFLKNFLHLNFEM